MFQYESKRILIWGKTYPELSAKHTETVCTGGVLEDGTPVRLYPIPLRYLEGDQQFKLYQWITAEIARDHRDARPESHRVDKETIRCEEVIPTTSDEWGKRAEYIFRHSDWQFDSLEDLQDRQRSDGTSLGIVEPKEIIKISIKDRPRDEWDEFLRKQEDLLVENQAKRDQIQLFDDYTVPELKKLTFVPQRLMVTWKCHGKDCNTHNTQVLDWGLIELQKKLGIDAAKAKLEEISDLDTYALKFYMGNIKGHPTSFTIVGLWYPKRPNEPRLF